MRFRSLIEILTKSARSRASPIRRVTGGVLFAALVATAANADGIESVVRFNTTCAQCHEGECSGRLSFTLGAKAAFDHIRRYAGNVDDAMAQALVDALSQMKTTCAFAPLSELPLSEFVKPSDLDRYRNPRTGAYFIPLGVLQTEAYRLELNLRSPAAFRIEIINEYFELLEEGCFGPATPTSIARLRVQEEGKAFLRVRGPDDLHLQSLVLGQE